MRKITILLLIIFLSTIFIYEAQPANLEKAISLYKKGEFKKCVKYLEDYIKTQPDPQAYYLLGYAYYKVKRYSDSIKCFKETYLIDPVFTPSKINFKNRK